MTDSPTPSNVNHADKQLQFEAKAEDAETRAARQELRHSHISDNQANTTSAQPSVHEDEDDVEMKLRSGKDYEYQPPAPRPKKKNPDPSPPEAQPAGGAGGAGESKVSSPKKKRAHDEVEENEDGEGRASNGAEPDDWVMVEGADKAETKEAEPQKKRARDEKSPPADIHKTSAAVSSREEAAIGIRGSLTRYQNTPDASKANSVSEDQPQTSSSAFEASGFARLASSSSSPFAAVGATKSVFGGGAASAPSPFASFSAASSTPVSAVPPPNPPKLTFGSQEPSALSQFLSINGNKTTSNFGSGFGSGFGGSSGFGGGGSVFGSALGGRTGNFASPGQPPIIKSDKPAKPFGAPESDAEDDDEDVSEAGDEERNGSRAETEKDKDKEKEKEDSASRDEPTTLGGDEEKKKFKRGKFATPTKPKRPGYDLANILRSRH